MQCRIRSFFRFSVLLFLLKVSAQDADCPADSQDCPAPSSTVFDETVQSCGLFLAPSTIPGAGLGIFTAIPVAEGDSTGRGDVCLPFVDMYWHGDWSKQNPFKDYFWDGRAVGMGDETATDDLEAYCPGIDCAVNCHLGLINIAKSTPTWQDGGLLRANDPGAGGFTPYHMGPATAMRDIPAGGELFKFYGDHWFTTRERLFGKHFPLSEDYEDAQTLLDQFLKITGEETNDETVALQQDLWRFSRAQLIRSNSISYAVGLSGQVESGARSRTQA